MEQGRAKSYFRYYIPWWRRDTSSHRPLMEEGTCLGSSSEQDGIRSARRVTWAEEPWASDLSPLLENGQRIPDTRPIRQSLRRGSKKLLSTGLSYQFQYQYEDEFEEIPEHKMGWGAKITLIIASALLVLWALLFGHLEISDPSMPIPPPFPGVDSVLPPHNRAVLVEAKYGAVATENELCSNIGVEALKQGGNAADAAVASTLCVGVVNMFSSGIGGGGFLTIRIPSNLPEGPSEVYTIDFREEAPGGANATMYLDKPLSSKFGGLSVAVPAELRGLAELHGRWGKLPWKQLVEPSANLARGWNVGPELARRMQMYAPLMVSPDWRSIFAPQGRILREGELISRPALAKTLQAIADHGPDVFYKGPIADALLEKISKTGGIMNQHDLDTYEVRVRKALHGTYHGRHIYTTHAPSSGMVLLHMLNLVEPLEGFLKQGRTGLNLHRMIEAMKFGFAARTRISDTISTADTKRMAEIPSKAFANLVRVNLTDDTTHHPSYYNPTYDSMIDHGTSHGTSIDKDGMVVSLTTSINLVFGSAVMDPVTGVILNDQMDDFSTPGHPNDWGLWPSPYNYPAPGKRPLSSISPVIVENADGEIELALGGSGGSRIFPAVFQTILGTDWGLDISQAIEYPRVHNQLFPEIVDIDDGLPAELVSSLIQRGHNVTVRDFYRITSVVQGVMVQNGTVFAASDSRKNGIAAGY